MTEQHTPGPWDYGVIREVLEFQPEWEDVSSDRLDADAALITAAPDLLAALEDIVQASDANDGGSLMDAIQAAQTIIAKAKGEQP